MHGSNKKDRILTCLRQSNLCRKLSNTGKHFQILVFFVISTMCLSVHAGDIETVKNGILRLNDSVTIGGVLDSYSDCKEGSIKWEQKITKQGAHAVIFTCELKAAATEFEKLKPVVISKIYKELLKQNIDSKTIAKHLDKYGEEVYGLLEDAEKPNQANTKILSYKIELASCELSGARLLIPFFISKAEQGQFKVNKDAYLELIPQDNAYANMETTVVTLDTAKLLQGYLYPNNPIINKYSSGSFWNYLRVKNQP